jgi:hypothetical protein
VRASCDRKSHLFAVTVRNTLGSWPKWRNNPDRTDMMEDYEDYDDAFEDETRDSGDALAVAQEAYGRVRDARQEMEAGEALVLAKAAYGNKATVTAAARTAGRQKAEAAAKRDQMAGSAPVMRFDVTPSDLAKPTPPNSTLPPPEAPVVPCPPDGPAPAGRPRLPKVPEVEGKPGVRPGAKPRPVTVEPSSEAVPSSRRTLGDNMLWQQETRLRMNTPARRSRVGLFAPPMALSTAIERHRLDGRSPRRARRKLMVPRLQKVPRLDFSQIAMLYGSSQVSGLDVRA